MLCILWNALGVTNNIPEDFKSHVQDKAKVKVKDKVLTFPIKPPRLANRVLQVTKNEADNSEDPRWFFSSCSL